MIAKAILYFGKPVVLACDSQCHKAWGINSRPNIRFDDEDDSCMLSDDELGDSPIDPGTYEGGDGKPFHIEDRLNKWCARECERSVIGDLGMLVQLKDFGMRIYNQPWKHPHH